MTTKRREKRRTHFFSEEAGYSFLPPLFSSLMRKGLFVRRLELPVWVFTTACTQADVQWWHVDVS
jgi:hypothetical protein